MEIQFLLLCAALSLLFVVISMHIFNAKQQNEAIHWGELVLLIIIIALVILVMFKNLKQ